MSISLERFSLASTIESPKLTTGLPETSWKIHALVVTGYLLMSIGLGLAIGSVFLWKAFSPMVALAAPALFLGPGSLLINHASDISLWISYFRKPPTAPFSGIANRGVNDCWINSALQILFHTPAFAERIQAAKKEFLIWSHPLKPLFDAYDLYQKGEPIDSRLIRNMLVANKVTSLDDNPQDDPIAFLNTFCKQVSYQLPTLYDKIVDKEGDKITNTIESQTSSRDPVRLFEFTPYIDPENPTLRKAFDRYFEDVVITDSGIIRTTVRFMKEPPSDLSISFSQAAEDGIKVVQKISIPFTLTLPSQYVGKETTYACDGFSYHWGNGANGGHWVSVIKKGDSWWLANDDSVTPLSDHEAFENLKKAAFVHYSKVC